MANLSNINNKFLFTDGDFLKIGNLAPINNISGTESGISITNGNVASITLDNTAASGKTFVIYSDDGGKLNFYDVDASSGRLVIDSSGRVGINDTVSGNFTTNYDTKLLVGGEIIARSLTASASMISIGGDATSAFIKVGKQDGSLTARPLRIEVGTSEAMRIDSSGNVLINATSKYNIYPAGFITETIATDAGDVCPILELVGNRSANPGNQNAMIQFFNKTSTAVEVGRIASSQGSATNSGELRFYTTYAGIISQRMIIDSSGNVGINDTNPNTANLSIKGQSSGVSANFPMLKLLGQNTSSDGLHITTTGSGNDHYAIKVATGGNSSAFNVTNAGNVGIGNTNPLSKLHITNGDSGASSAWTNADDLIIENSGNAGLAFQTPNTGAATIAFQDPESVQAGFIQYLHADNALRFATNGNNERMRIDSSGNSIFYGTIKSFSTGAAHLILNGDTNNSGDSGEVDAIIDFRGDGNPGLYGYRINTENWSGQTALNFQEYINGSYTSRLFISKDGNVGIGMTSPATTLQVSGSSLTNNVAQWIGGGFIDNDLYHREGAILGISGTNATQTSAGIAFQTRNTNNTNYWKSSILMNRGGQLEFYTGGAGTGQGSERMRIETDGGIFFPSLGGFSVSNSDVRYNATSDELYYQTSSKRYKSEITDLENSLDKVNNLRPVRFKDNLSQEYATGMIAEEVAEIIPEVVFTKPIDGFDEPQIEGINYSDIVPFLIKSIQELKADNDSLKARIETLENK